MSFGPTEKLDAAFDALVAAAAGAPRALAVLAGKARDRGDMPRAVDLVMAATAAAPDDREIASLAADIFGSAVPKWHFAMVRDAARNAAFQGAIERAVTPDCHVLDIGAGSGLLAMMAARAGAARVHSCEANGAIAAAAARIIAVNGYADRVTLIPRHSTDIDPETDMGGRADLIVSEIVGKDLVAEGVLPALRDAARRLLKPGGRMIPQGGDIVVALGWSSLAADAALGDVCGFDVSAFNQLLPPHHSVLTDDPRIVIRGPDAPLFAFDFTTTAAAATRADLVLCSDGSGPVNGVLQWIRLHMDEQERLENRPGPGAASHWAVQFHPFSSMLDLAAGQGVRIMGAHTHNRLRLWRPDDAVLAG